MGNPHLRQQTRMSTRMISVGGWCGVGGVTASRAEQWARTGVVVSRAASRNPVAYQRGAPRPCVRKTRPFGRTRAEYGGPAGVKTSETTKTHSARAAQLVAPPPLLSAVVGKIPDNPIEDTTRGEAGWPPSCVVRTSRSRRATIENAN